MFYLGLMLEVELSQRTCPILRRKYYVCRKGSLELLNSIPALYFPIPETGHQMVVHHPDRLHERVTDRRSDEREAAFLQVLAHRI